jgi:hypothetical protein
VRRILLVLTIALVMAAMVVAMAAPAFAARPPCTTDVDIHGKACAGVFAHNPGGT